jgi:hypothetical protein
MTGEKPANRQISGNFRKFQAGVSDFERPLFNGGRLQEGWDGLDVKVIETLRRHRFTDWTRDSLEP